MDAVNTSLDARRWEAVQSRSQAADGQFVVAVRTTHIYCRPSCKSRQPKRENVEFFPLPDAAEAAGYRACKRCRPRDVSPADERLALVQDICAYLRDHAADADAIALDALGRQFGYAPQHVQAVFRETMGVTPRQFAESCRLRLLKDALRQSDSVAGAVYEAGFGSASRVYERSDARMGMTPAQYRAGGAGAVIRYAVADTDFGWMLLGATVRGVCAVELHDSPEQAAESLQAEFPAAAWIEDESLISTAQAIAAHVRDGAPLPALTLDVRATAFQARVWAALQAIPRGETRTYSDIARAIGQPSAVRAVAAACASNQAALVIPCHRVIGTAGDLRGYKWGIDRKQKLLDSEGQVGSPR